MLDFSSLIEGFTSGGAAGSAVPGIGTAIGSFGGAATAFIGGLVGGPKTDDVQQSADINQIAANNHVTPAHAAAVIAWHANHSSDHFNDLAAYVASTNSRFASLLDEYNSGNPAAPVYVGEVANTGVAAIQGLSMRPVSIAGSQSIGGYTIPNVVANQAPSTAQEQGKEAAPASSTNTTKYALIGGGSLLALIILILLLK